MTLRDRRAMRRVANPVPVRTTEDLEFERQNLDLTLKSRYGFWLLILLAAQLVIADGLMFLYAWKGYHWKVPNTVMQAWLGATVAQLIGIVLVVVTHLFPRLDGTSKGVAAPPPS
jgi:hypothetical protein